MYKIGTGVFYITNVCNLTCENCESYNNKRFKGHYFWQDHKSIYEKWSEILYIDSLIIQGGEPFANPKLFEWAEQLKRCWPNSSLYSIGTNGTYLKKNIELSKKLINIGWYLDITIHDPSHIPDVEKSIKLILENIDFYIEKEPGSITYKNRNTNRQLITVEADYYFYNNSTKEIKDGVIHMHRNDIEKAHTLCMSEEVNQCHFFVNGNLYKCFLTGISQELIKQFQIESYAQELLNSYRPASSFDSVEFLNDFFKNIEKPIKQCTLCPQDDTKIKIIPLKEKKD